MTKLEKQPSEEEKFHTAMETFILPILQKDPFLDNILNKEAFETIKKMRNEIFGK